ncbi:MAG: carboxypeptidase regulatory-like domain-containing protein [Holophagales bacterium]|nr:carboxypeptidase regulatory-like domain-containing protein [Holophagales bacterium]
MTPRIRSLTTILWVLFLGISSFALAQDHRGTIKGRIVDNSGGELPGVSVTITNVETNVSANAMTDAKGFYRVPYLNAGKYDVTAKLTGLQPTARKGISVNVGSVLTVDLIMTLGVSSEIVVTGGAPLLDQTSPVTGQVVTREQIKELPLADGTAYMLSRIAPGIVETSDLHFSRPGDNANLGGVVANGVRGGNDFTLDGAPNIVSDRRVGFSPPSEAISSSRSRRTRSTPSPGTPRVPSSTSRSGAGRTSSTGRPPTSTARATGRPFPPSSTSRGRRMPSGSTTGSRRCWPGRSSRTRPSSWSRTRSSRTPPESP